MYFPLSLRQEKSQQGYWSRMWSFAGYNSNNTNPTSENSLSSSSSASAVIQLSDEDRREIYASLDMGQTLKQLTVPPEYACSLKFHKHINL
jgi:hypothetical protein